MSKNSKTCTSCKQTQQSIERIEKRLMRIEYLLKKQAAPEVIHKVRENSFKPFQTLEEFDEHEEKLHDETYVDWLRQLLIDVSDHKTLPTKAFLHDSISKYFNLNGKYGKRGFAKTNFFKKIYLPIHKDIYQQTLEQIQDFLKLEFHKSKNRWYTKLCRNKMSAQVKIENLKKEDQDEDEDDFQTELLDIENMTTYEPSPKRQKMVKEENSDSEEEYEVDDNLKEEADEECIDLSDDNSPNYSNIDQFIEEIPQKN